MALRSPPDVELVARLSVCSHGAPLIVLLADTREAAAIQCLEAGADDCIREPYSMAMVAARIAATRRFHQGHPSRSRPRLQHDEERRAVYVGGRWHPLTDTEYRLMLYLGQDPNRWVQPSELARQVLGAELRYDSSLIRVHVLRIRRKLAGAANCLQSSRQLGLRLSPESEPVDLASTPRA